MTNPTLDLTKTWARVVAKAWADEEFKQRLLADPAAIAREEGVAIPDGLTVRVIEDAPGTRTLVLPPPPAQLDAGAELEERRAASDDEGKSDPPGYYNTFWDSFCGMCT